MNTKHTPGPWKVFEDDFYTVGVESEGSVIADHLFESNDLTIEDIKQELYANAKLIAAAPDLLETLEHICRLYQDADTIINKKNFRDLAVTINAMAKSAIRKAGAE